MQRIYDLHCHTSRSDGVLTPSQLVQRAAERGVGVLAVTDHDVTDGLAEATQAAGHRGIELVSGVEISVTWYGRTLHVIGLGIDPGNEILARGLFGLRAQRNDRAREIGERLHRAGIEGAYDGARRYAQGEIFSRTHFARFLANHGHAPDMRRAFKNYLQKNRPGHVRGQWAALEDCLHWIRSAGGAAIIAHPARYRMGAGTLRRLLGEFREAGGAGIEVVTGNGTAEESERFARLAGEFGLLASCGSDFHGPDQHWLELGRLAPLPGDCTPVWQAWSF